MESATATRFFEIGGHAPDGVDFKISVSATAQLFGCFEGGCCMFGKVAEERKSVMLGRGVKVWFSEGVLALTKASEESFVSG